MRARDHVGDDFGIFRIRHARLEDANDGRSAISKAAEPNGFADNVRILVEGRRPETVRKDYNAGSLRAIVLRPYEAAEYGTKTHQREIVAANDAASNRPRLTEADHGEVHGGKITKGVHGFHARTQVL